MGRLVKQLFAALLFLSLAACGGGGGDGGSGPTHAPPTATIANVQPVLAGATITLDGSGSTAAAGLTLSYNWVLTSKPAGSAASLQNASSAKPSLSTDLAGDYLLTLTVNDGQLSSSPSTRTVTVLPALSIQTSSAEPLSGTVTLSLSGYTPGMQVAWYLDQAEIGSGASVSWDSTKVTNGSHLVTAWLEVAGKVSEIRRTVAVANSEITLSANTAPSPSAEAGLGLRWTQLDVSANSPRGIASVAATLDGRPIGVLTSANACTGLACSVLNIYRFFIENKTFISGEHVAVVTATDGAGATRQITVNVQIANPPVITLDTPAEGAIVSGTLPVSGSFSSDKPGPVTLRAWLGALEFLTTTQSPFQASYDLKGLPAGPYVLTVRATDSTGVFTEKKLTVTVAVSSGG